jgi:hypothetical protein
MTGTSTLLRNRSASTSLLSQHSPLQSATSQRISSESPCCYYWTRPLGSPDEYRRLVVISKSAKTVFWGAALHSVQDLLGAINSEGKIAKVEILIGDTDCKVRRDASKTCDADKSASISTSDWGQIVGALARLGLTAIVLNRFSNKPYGAPQDALLNGTDLDCLFHRLGRLRSIQICFLPPDWDLSFLAQWCPRLECLEIYQVTLNAHHIQSLSIALRGLVHLNKFVLLRVSLQPGLSCYPLWQSLRMHSSIVDLEIDSVVWASGMIWSQSDRVGEVYNSQDMARLSATGVCTPSTASTVLDKQVTNDAIVATTNPDIGERMQETLEFCTRINLYKACLLKSRPYLANSCMVEQTMHVLKDWWCDSHYVDRDASC